MAEKYFITPTELHNDSFDLARQIYDSGFRPDFMMALWRGGTPVGIAVHEYLQLQDFLNGEKRHDRFGPDHVPIRTSRYNDEEGVGGTNEHVNVIGLEYFVNNANHDDSLLIIDDVHDAGTTIKAVIEDLKRKSRRNTPKDIRVAMVHYKPDNNETGRVPEFYLYETEHWLVYPHELMGLTDEERRIKTDIIDGRRENKVSLVRKVLEERRLSVV
tara:strand:- start:9350 stop:9994 length:645 start_codon:yes stop_codon:yes gene_type:complete